MRCRKKEKKRRVDKKRLAEKALGFYVLNAVMCEIFSIHNKLIVCLEFFEILSVFFVQKKIFFSGAKLRFKSQTKKEKH